MSATSEARERLLRMYGLHPGFYACYSELAQTYRRNPPPGTFVVPGAPTTSVSTDAGDFICNTTTYGRPFMTTTDTSAAEVEAAADSPARGEAIAAFLSALTGDTGSGSEVLLRVRGLPVGHAVDLVQPHLVNVLSRDDGRLVDITYEDDVLTLSLTAGASRCGGVILPLGVMVMQQEDTIGAMAFMLTSVSILTAIRDAAAQTLDDLQTDLPGAPGDLYESLVATFVEEGLVVQEGDDIHTATFEITLRGRVLLALMQDYDIEPQTTDEVASAVDAADDTAQVEKILNALQEAGTIYRHEDGRWAMREAKTEEPASETPPAA